MYLSHLNPVYPDLIAATAASIWPLTLPSGRPRPDPKHFAISRTGVADPGSAHQAATRRRRPFTIVAVRCARPWAHWARGIAAARTQPAG